MTSTSEPWRRNLTVCAFGSITTVVAMTLLLPFLPLFIEQLGVQGHAAVVQWSGIAYGSTFLTAGIVAPLWGRLGDRFGRKPNLVRASLGMAITMSLTGFCQNIAELVILRLIIGFAGGYATGSIVLIAIQTPKVRSAWALGVLSSAIMAGNIVGPLIGGTLPHLIGIRGTFLVAGAGIFIAFLATLLFVRESPTDIRSEEKRTQSSWSQIPDKQIVFAMLVSGTLLLFANMSIEPIITVYVGTLLSDPRQITLIAGIVMSAAALGSVISSAQLGKLADRIGHSTVIIVALTVAGLLLIPQAFVTNGIELIALRFLMGLALGGLMPSITAVIRHNVPDHVAGTVLGLTVAANYMGQVSGPIVGGFIGGHIGLRAVFIGTCVLMLLGAAYNWRAVGFRPAANAAA